MPAGRKLPTIGWIPAGTIDDASSRLQAILPHDWLVAEGLPSRLLRRSNTFRRRIRAAEMPGLLLRIVISGVRTVVFQKTALGQAPRLMRICRSLGIRVVYVECDLPGDLGFLSHVDVIVATSDALARHIAERTGRQVERVGDPVETWDPARLERGWRVTPGAKPAAVWVGGKKNWPQVERLQADLAALGPLAPFTLSTISNHPNATLPWRRDRIAADIAGFDLGVIPVGTGEAALMKSENRATLFMALGLPVAVEASPVYDALVTDGETGLVWCDTESLGSLGARLADDAQIEAIRARAYRAAQPFSEARVMDQWRAILRL